MSLPTNCVFCSSLGFVNWYGLEYLPCEQRSDCNKSFIGGPGDEVQATGTGTRQSAANSE